MIVAGLSGCGGGGHASPNKTLAGTLLGADDTPLAGDTVIYDKGDSDSETTVTDAHGQYKLVIMLDAITGSDTLSFYDAAGHLVDVVTVTLDKNTRAIEVTTIAPPEPPTQL
jgi:hypothetical protein